MELSGLGHGCLHGQAAKPAPGVGDDAIGAEIHAAVLNFQHGPGAAGDSPGGQLLKVPPLEGLVNAGAALACGHGLLHGLHQLGPLGSAEDYIRPQGGYILSADLRIAAADGHHGAGVFLLQAADGLAGFAAAFGGDGAGVDDDGVGQLPGNGPAVALLLQ